MTTDPAALTATTADRPTPEHPHRVRVRWVGADGLEHQRHATDPAGPDRHRAAVLEVFRGAWDALEVSAPRGARWRRWAVRL